MLWQPLYIGFLFLEKNIKISIFGQISKFFKLIVFWIEFGIFGNFGKILLHCQWLTQHAPIWTENFKTTLHLNHESKNYMRQII